jgi:DNA-binding transcriptional regulator LsrR (DeoR family)
MIRVDHLTNHFYFAIVKLSVEKQCSQRTTPKVHMPPDNNFRKLLYKIAVLYYQDGLTQKQIGKRFGLSRIKVSRLLRQAREKKVVQIHITPADGPLAELERAIDAKYNLDEVIATTPPEYSRSAIIKSLAPVAVEGIMRSIQGKEVIAITWGSSLNAMVDALPPANYPNIRVVQCLGGLSSPDAEVNGVDIVRRLAQSLGARPLLLSAPGLVANKDVRDALLMDTQISKILSIASKADIAVVGIGVYNSESVILQNNILSNAEMERLKAKGAVGDIGMRFFNCWGEKIEDEIDERIIGLDLEHYKRIKRVIGVAGGEDKVEAIRAALHGKLIDVLVTDDKTAQYLLDDEPSSPINKPPRRKSTSINKMVEQEKLQTAGG